MMQTQDGGLLDNVASVARKTAAPVYVRATQNVTLYSRSVEIDCSAEKAFAFCFSLEGFKAHCPHPVKDYVGPARWRKGEVASFKYRQVFWTHFKVLFLEAQENVMFKDVMLEGPLEVFEHTHRFETLAPNRIRYTDSVEFASGLGRFLDGLIGIRMMNSLFTQRHAALKPALER